MRRHGRLRIVAAIYIESVGVVGVVAGHIEGCCLLSGCQFVLLGVV